MRKVDIVKGRITLTDKVECVIEKKVTPFGSGAKVDCPKQHMGKRVYLVISKD
jgi:putative transposon-encoded protein